jgi:predicted phosphodiesterase
MRLAYLSDLHLEFARLSSWESFIPKNWDIDWLVLAGDIGRDVPQLDLFFQFCKKQGYNNIIYVPGNHEYYRGNYRAQHWELEKLAYKHGICFCDTVHKSGEFLFIPTTLWAYLQPDSLEARLVEKRINDFRIIEGMTPALMSDLHLKAKVFLESALKFANMSNLKPIVVTHFSPSMQGLHPRYNPEDVINKYFHNSLEELILTYHPPLWIHGHTHDLCDYWIEETHILCNPIGYPGENEKRSMKVLEL